MSRRSGRVIALGIVAGVMTAGLSAGVLAAAAVALRADGDLMTSVWQVLLAGSPAVVVISVGVGVLAGVVRRRMGRLRRGAKELEALELRVRMADEVAERQRRIAETSSVGMFELLSGLVAAEEGARGQLSAELHDTVAQSLMSVRSLLDSEDPSSVRRASYLVAEAEEQVRAVMARTRPPALREGDLALAVSGLRDDMRHRYGIAVEIGWPTEAYPMPLATAVTVYRFFQEAMLNIVKHADVEVATADLRIDEDWVVAVVADRGEGFDPGAVVSEGGRHVGLGLLRERARLSGGSLTIRSVRWVGTTLTLRLPRIAASSLGGSGVELPAAEPVRSDTSVEVEPPQLPSQPTSPKDSPVKQ